MTPEANSSLKIFKWLVNLASTVSFDAILNDLMGCNEVTLCENERF